MAYSPVIVLIHGIRTAASWQNRVASIIKNDNENAEVIPIKYQYFDLISFWCPLNICRKRPIERITEELETIFSQYKDRPVIVIAHSYGTYALAHVINNPLFKFNKIILCGSVISNNFEWNKVANQVNGQIKRDSIINECGTKDIWPVLANSATWGYGATGTYGFGTAIVRDRFHVFKHSDYFEEDFIVKNWLPIINNKEITFSEEDKKGGGSSFWFTLLWILPIKWIVVLLLIFTGVQVRKNSDIITNSFNTLVEWIYPSSTEAKIKQGWANVDKRDFKKAFNYFQSAANDGNSSAQFQIAFMYEVGQGVSKNLGEAVRFYNLAADQGHIEAKNSIERIRKLYDNQ